MHSHSLQEFQDALKIFVVDVYLGKPAAVKLADNIIHLADNGNQEAVQICDLMADICANTVFTDTNGNRIHIGACGCNGGRTNSIGHCCASCAAGGPCKGGS